MGADSVVRGNLSPGPVADLSRRSAVTDLGTAEVRWILPGRVDTAVVEWFARFPAGLESRDDAYLVNPVLRGLSVKIRGNQLLETKVYHGSLGILDAAGRARGRIEAWQKWSFPFGPLGPDSAGPPGWTVVRKKRRFSRFRLAGGRLVATSPERITGRSCAVELTEFRSGGQTQWTLGFEATGPAGSLISTLQTTAAMVFAKALPGGLELGLGQCQSYSEWLSRRRVSASQYSR
jgi:hypothetical protein